MFMEHTSVTYPMYIATASAVLYIETNDELDQKIKVSF